ncbi:lytic transglycosylase domain-containing protein [Rhodoferax sp.]|uniref:lytic transglycosylase domain-containing protein n=1 Tax=Rhodoferax sp. TaxID=50421 RepID=UPI001A06B76F|nr:transglycosylase SLT domain-containing protein [Rhodoferax sp.]MBE0474833.1 transglycosylase SLT domain-containing protein [Rhodoferax sp.]
MNLNRWNPVRCVATLVCALTGFHAGAQDFALPGTAQQTLFEQARAYEHGEGVPRDAQLATLLYCEAARRGDRDAQYNLGWIYANGRGVARDDAAAAYLFQAASEQGIEAAQRMLAVLGELPARMPECMRAPEPEPVPEAPQVADLPRVDYALIAPRKILNLVMKLAPQFKVEPQLALAIMAAESNFDPLAVSPKNAQGLMQLIPETSERFNVKNAFDPAQNIRGGLTYLRWLLAYFEGDVTLVAAAYNSGEGTVERYRGVPPYKETRSYVQRILRNFGNRHHPFEARVTRPSPPLKTIRLQPLQ